MYLQCGCASACFTGEKLSEVVVVPALETPTEARLCSSMQSELEGMAGTCIHISSHNTIHADSPALCPSHFCLHLPCIDGNAEKHLMLTPTIGAVDRKAFVWPVSRHHLWRIQKAQTQSNYQDSSAALTLSHDHGMAEKLQRQQVSGRGPRLEAQT